MVHNLGFISAQALCVMPVLPCLTVELSEIKDVPIFCIGSDYNSVFMAYEHTAF